MTTPARARALLTLALALAPALGSHACRRTPSAPAGSDATTGTASPTATEVEPSVNPMASLAPPRPTVDPMALTRACERVRAASRAVVSEALAGNPRGCPNERALALRTRFDSCEQGPAGAWALSLRALSVRRPGAQWDGRWALVHITRDGSETWYEPQRFSDAENHPANLRAEATRYDTVTDLRVSDLDGDGDAEAFVTERGAEGTIEHARVGVFTARSGAVTPYAPASRYEIEDARDVDEDGRLDLLHYGPYAGFESLCGGDETPFGAVLLLAHTAPDGSFVEDSGIAISHARRACGRRPGDVSAGLPDAPPPDAGADGSAAAALNDEDPSRAAPEPAASGQPDAGSPNAMWRAAGRAVACARMYGATSAAVERMLARSCRSYASPEPCARPSLTPGVCPSYLLHWARVEPPLRLR